MPQGNAHMVPPGVWWEEPTPPGRARLFLQSGYRLALVGSMIAAFWFYRSLAHKYTYTNFIGKTMSLGQTSILDHEPLTPAEIDKLKEAEIERKRYAKMFSN